MTPGRINQIAAFSSSRALPARALGLTPRLCYSGPPGARSARGLSFVLKPACFSSNRSTRPSCARLQARFGLRTFPAQALPASPSCPLLWLSWRVGLRADLSLMFLLGEASWSSPAAAVLQRLPLEFPRGNRRGACLLASSTNDCGTRTSANLSPFQALSVFIQETRLLRSQSQRAQRPALAAAIQRGELLRLLAVGNRSSSTSPAVRRRFEGARARKLSHNARPSLALSTPETPHGRSLRLSLEPVFGSLSRKGLQAEGPSRDGASALTLTLREREPCWRRGAQVLGQPWGWSR